MVEQKLVTNLKTVLEALELKYQPVTVFAVLKMDELSDKWTVLLSAEWVRNYEYDDLFTDLRQLLMDNLGDEMNNIARFGIFDLTSHLVEMIREGYRDGSQITASTPLNGNIIHEAYFVKVS